MLDSNYRRAVMSAGSFLGFLIDILKNPLSLILLFIIIYMILSQLRIFRGNNEFTT